MSDKRFRLDLDYGFLIDEEHKLEPIGFNERVNFNELCDFLNALHEENLLLKGEVAHYKLTLMGLEETAKKFMEKHTKKGFK